MSKRSVKLAGFRSHRSLLRLFCNRLESPFFNCVARARSPGSHRQALNYQQRPARRRTGATPGSGATSACAAAAVPVASALRETPPAEIPLSPAASSSERDSLLAGVPRLLRAGPCISAEAFCEANRALSTCGTGFSLWVVAFLRLKLAQTEVCATGGGAAEAWAGTVCALRLRGAANEWRATLDPWR